MSRISQILRFIYNHPLARKRLFYACFKFISWQLIQFFSNSPRVIKLTRKTKIWAKKGMTGVTGSIYTGLHEFEDMGFMLHFLRKDDLFADIGANVGIYTILASTECEAKSLCFEPAPETYSWLKKNIDLNNISSCANSFNIGIGNIDGVLIFSSDLDTVNHVLSSKSNNIKSVEVSVKSFDSIAKDFGIPVLIKIDVEGYEFPVIQGLHNTLLNSHLKAIIIELNGSGKNYGFDEKKIHEILILNGFKPCSYDPLTKTICELETFGNLNTIYIRDLNYAIERVKNSREFNVFGFKF